MIIDKNIKELLHERQELFSQVSPFETVLLENDDGLIDIENNEPMNDQWYSELDTDNQQAVAQSPEAATQIQAAAAQQAVAQSPEAATQMQTATAQMQTATAQQAVAQSPEAATQMQAIIGQMQGMLDPDDLAAIQISQTQEVFTKMYLVKRLDKLKRYINNLIDLMEMKFDIDEFDQLKRIAVYIETLDQIALILPADTLFHIIVDFEFELLEIIDKINKIANDTIQEYHKQEKDII